MLHRVLGAFGTLALLVGCTTPFHPPVFVYGAPDFPGLVEVVERSGSRPVDVVLVHGMCTHDAKWAKEAVDLLVEAVDSSLKPSVGERPLLPTEPDSVQVVKRTEQIVGGTIRFTALVWSPLTARLKQQLAYDSTGTPTDCSASGECKPRRARLNGQLKDGLLNDCLADALIYQGQSHATIKQKMVDAISQVIEESQVQARNAGTSPGPLVLVSESLGSKLAFDALSDMLGPQASGRARAAGLRARERLAVVFMGANQIPILSLAEQNIAHRAPGFLPEDAPPTDSLQRFLRTMRTPPLAGREFSKMTLVAFTDPNDLLSYRLQASRYAGPSVEIADVLVSNASTYFGFLERPDTAHKGYRSNTDVATNIACGRPKSPRCK